VGLIRAAVGSLGGTLADQWKDFHTVPEGLWPTAAIFPAVRRGTNASRGSNTQASDSVISNGSKIVIPEGYALVTLQDGELTSMSVEAGAYIWNSDDPVSETIFAGDGIVSPLIKQSWERFKFGGRPGAQQIALFVNLKELPNNKFGTQSSIYWDDSYLNAQVGATTRGTYTLKIVDPVLFIKNFVPAAFLQNGAIFDFTDIGNDVSVQLFNEVIASLSAAFSGYTNDVASGNRITNIQRDSVGFSASLSRAVDDAFQWKSDRGLTIEKVAILGIEYDESTRELLKTVQRADALSGSRGNSNLQASVAAGLEAAGSVDGAAGILGLGVAAGGVGISNLQQPAPSAEATVASSGSAGASVEDELVTKLAQLKKALDAGLISEEEFNAARAKALGL
jgi:membrane protease subunit (stomatin/prohibitin family)